jgi:hypothetical protein
MFDYACEHGATFHLWGHSMEVDKLGAWQELDRFFAHVASRIPIENRLNNEQLVARHFPRAAHHLTAGCY